MKKIVKLLLVLLLLAVGLRGLQKWVDYYDA